MESDWIKVCVRLLFVLEPDTQVRVVEVAPLSELRQGLGVRVKDFHTK